MSPFWLEGTLVARLSLPYFNLLTFRQLQNVLSSPVNKKTPFRKLAFRLIGAIFILGLSLGLAAFFRFFDYPFLAGQAESISIRYREAGLPWEATDLSQIPPVKESENAAPILKQAYAAFDKPKFDSEYRDLQFLLLKNDPATVNRRLSHYSTAIKHAVVASSKPRLDFHRDWDDGLDILMPEIGFNKQLVRALCLRAEANAGIGMLSLAVADLKAALRLSYLVSQEGEWITINVRLTCENFVTASIARVAGLSKSSKEHLNKLVQLLDRVGGRIDFRRAYRIHSYLTLAMLRNRKFGIIDMGEPIPGKRRTGLPTTMISKAYAAKFMTFQLREKPIVDKYGFDLERFSEARKELAESTWSQNAGSDAMNSILVPQMGIPNSAKLLLARKVAGKCLVQALLYRAESGKLPTSLSQIPGNHIDPFSKLNLKFIRTTESIRIYSIGPDGVDNGGYRQSETKPTITYDDIIATYPPLIHGDR